MNLANRPTLRAFEQAHATARAAGETRAADELLARARTRWGSTAAFRCSSLATDETGIAAELGLTDSTRPREEAYART